MFLTPHRSRYFYRILRYPVRGSHFGPDFIFSSFSKRYCYMPVKEFLLSVSATKFPVSNKDFDVPNRDFVVSYVSFDVPNKDFLVSYVSFEPLNNKFVVSNKDFDVPNKKFLVLYVSIGPLNKDFALRNSVQVSRRFPATRYFAGQVPPPGGFVCFYLTHSSQNAV